MFETTATTAASSNLVLSVMNDGNVYMARLEAAKRLIAGFGLMRTFREITNEEAVKQRKEFGSKFKAADIAEAAKIIQKETIEEVLEQYKYNYNPEENILCAIRRWHDKTYGNSYFSCRAYIPQKDSMDAIVCIPFQYGYGNQPQWETIVMLQRLGIIEDDKNKAPSQYPINFEDQGYMLKKQNWTTGLYI